ncbi:MAG: 3-dehydroquinate synthase [Phycisphaeraceae bacterium]|nr:3-dehydroquinate synthase [Phycisphaeraceae bacterium]
MPTVDLTLPHHRYQIHVEPGLLGKLGTLVKAVAPHHLCAVFADSAVEARFGPTTGQSLKDAGYGVTLATVHAGESHKNLAAIEGMYQTLITHRLERRSPVIALGGGVIGDSVGFAAATYLRGVPFVQCPTTLLAMVDASVGGKVGVNLPQGKNLVGAFHQPVLVAIDTNTLGTLSGRELRCGLAECVKHAVIRDPKLFDWIEKNLPAILALDPAALVELVRWNVQIKANVVMADEKETGERAHLNFGHTFAHAIEATQQHDSPTAYHHGEAVSLGMVAATRLAVDAGRCPPEVLKRLTGLLERIGLPTKAQHLAHTPCLMTAMRIDKKVADARIRLILPTSLGAVTVVNDAPDAAIEAAWETIRKP